MSHVARRRYHRRPSPERRKAHLLARLAVLIAIARWSRRAPRYARQQPVDRVAGGAIARVTITGLIRSDRDRVEALNGWANRAPAVIVHINSPGGTTAGSEQLHDLMRLGARKPLVVVVDGLAASGGYITAIAADHIVAQETSLVGSIACCSSIQRQRSPCDARRQGRGDRRRRSRPRPTASSRPRRRRAPRSESIVSDPMPGSAACEARRQPDEAMLTAPPMAACSPAPGPQR
jgi:membrane-bound ClpP family serine protease